MLTDNLTGSNTVGIIPTQRQDGSAALDEENEYEVPDLIEEIIGN